MSNSDRLLDVRDLKIQFHADEGIVTAVDGISFHVNKGETLAIVGESGSGKSVTSLSILGLIPKPAGRIAGGEIMFKDKALLSLSAREMRRVRGKEISMIFQEPMTSLNPVYTVGDQIAEAIIEHENTTRAEARKRVIDLLRLVEIPDPEARANYYPHQMSGGQRQRVMIAMALSCKPSLLIADEPTTALDVIVQAQILDLIKKLQREIGTTVIFVTHDLGVVAEIADRVLVMRHGQIVEHGSVEDIFGKPQHPYTQKLLAAVPRIDAAKLAPTIMNQAPILLDVKALRTWFPVKKGLFQRTQTYIKAVNDISLNMRRGEIVGLVGESGSGKTTAGRSILRLIEPTSGSVILNGSDLTKLTSEKLRKFRQKAQIVFQDPYASLNPRMTIGEIVAEPLQVHGLLKSGKQRDQKVADLLGLVQLDAKMAKRYPRELSGGQRQRVGIARALSVEPEFIVADECVSALDVSIRREILDLIKELRTRLGLTMLFISHDLSVVEEISDRVAVMYKGDIVEINDSHTIYRSPTDDYTRALLSAIPIPDPTVKRAPLVWDPTSYNERRKMSHAVQ